MNFPNNLTQQNCVTCPQNDKQAGFSLIECVIAIAILATVVGSMISMQGTIARILQFSTDKDKAGIALRSVMAQFEFVLNTKGSKSLPKIGETEQWNSKSDTKFTKKISIIKSDIKLSKFLDSAIKIYFLGREEDAPDTNNFRFIGDKLDTEISLQLVDPSFNAETSVSWFFGKDTKSLSEKMFLMNNDAIELLTPPKVMQ